MNNQVEVVVNQAVIPAVVEVTSAGPQGPQGPPGPAGIGSAWHQGTGLPSSELGNNGDYYLDTLTGNIYGPKAYSSWNSAIFNIAEGQAGPSGADGKTLLNGTSTPSNATGSNGDFFINSAASIIYGPKAAGVWPSGVSLVGPAGVTGATGPQGSAGVVAATAPIIYDAGAQTVSISAATINAAGSMSAADKAKLDGLNGTNYATAAQGIKADTAVQPADLAAVQSALASRLDRFRDARTFYVSKRIGASDTNNGTSPGEPFLTVGAAVAAANAFRLANPTEFAAIEIGPGTYVEVLLPLRLASNVLIRSLKQRCVRMKPAAGQELHGFFAVDSGCMVCDITFAGHQAENTSATDSSVGTRAWAIAFNEQANGGQGVYLTASPYIKDCLSLTAEDDDGVAGSTSTGDCGGGVEVDGSKCHSNSPIRSMVVYGFTQSNLGGPGAVVKNDGYAELVSFFGLFGTWHVRCETGGQATLSGGGCSEFGVYGLVADGYSPTPLFTGSLLAAAAQGATTVDVGSLSANRLGSSSRPAAGQLLLLGGGIYVVQSSTPITGGYRVTFYADSGTGLAAAASQGAAVNFRQRSQISTGCHSANYVGSGTNYNALPWNGGVPNRANEIVERNHGRVFGAVVNDIGDFKIAGGAFAVDGTTGAVTINTSQFNLSGLNAIGPFSRNGGFSTVGVQLREVSNDTGLVASTGQADGNTAPTQYAVAQYLQTYYTPLTDGRLGDSREWLASTVTQAEAEAGTATTRRAWTAQRVFQATASWWAGSSAASKLAGIQAGATANATDAQLRDRSTHTGTQSAGTITGLSTVATSGAYGDLSGRPTLGTAAATASTDYATAAQGAKADTAVQPGALGSAAYLTAGAVAGNVPVLDAGGKVAAAVLPSYVDDVIESANLAAFPGTGETGKIYVAIDTGKTYRWSGSAYIEISASPGSTDAVSEGSVNLYFTTGRASAAAPVQSVAGRTGNVTLSVSDLSGLAPVATSGAYSDLSGRPTLGTAASLNTGTSAGNVVALDGTGRLPAVDGSQLTGLPPGGVTSIALSAPSGFSVSGSPITTSGTLSLSFDTGYSLPTTAKQSQWDAAYAGYLQWDGGATGLNAATARTSLGLGSAATTAASSYATAAQGALADTAVQPAGLSGYLTSDTAASTYQPLDGDLTSIAALTTTMFGRSLLTQADAAAARTTLGAGTGNGTVSSVGLSLPGLFSVSGSPVTSSGTLTAALATQVANRLWAGPTTGADAAPTFRTLVAGDLGTTLQPQFARIGVNTAPSSLFHLAANGAAIVRHQSVTISGSTYTFDVGVASEFTCGAAINGATTFALSNHDQLPAASGGVGWRTRSVITFTWTSGTITFGASGYTFSQSAVTLTSGQTYNAILTITSSSTVIGVQYTLGRS